MGFAQPETAPDWWRSAVIYEVYPRSFKDENADGMGDLAGIRAQLGYLHQLGVDAIWVAPWYVSPQADGGYDIADYRAIDPTLGSLADAEALIDEALALGIRTIVDIVPNHVSEQHPWFQEALDSGPGSPARDRFWFRPGKGSDGRQIPTSWVSSFQGSTWTRTSSPDGTPGDWYLHLFTAQQPDLNWSHPDVAAEFEDVLRFWFDRGVAGVRVDSAALVIKDAALPEYSDSASPGTHPHIDRDELHEVYRAWRKVADSYAGTRVLVGEVWLDDSERFARYLRSDEMHTAFNFDFLAQPWDADSMRRSIDSTLTAHAPIGAPATWVLSNHDVTRPVTRYGRTNSSFSFAAKKFGTPTDIERGLRRARAAAMLTAALPGSLYIYQGDELGLPEVEDLPPHTRIDPMHFRSGGVDPGRDGCRVPMPWSGDRPPFGFSTGAVATWLPQPADWADLTVSAQLRDPASTLQLYQSILRLRHLETCLRSSTFGWIPARPGVLAFNRGELDCMVNLGEGSIELPSTTEVLLTSAPLENGRLAADAAAWLRTTPSAPQ